jgi:heat shock protein HslJ
MRDEQFYNRVGSERISSRQIDELIGIARGLCADNQINQLEVELFELFTTGFKRSWPTAM